MLADGSWVLFDCALLLLIVYRSCCHCVCGGFCVDLLLRFAAAIRRLIFSVVRLYENLQLACPVVGLTGPSLCCITSMPSRLWTRSSQQSNFYI